MSDEVELIELITRRVVETLAQAGRTPENHGVLLAHASGAAGTPENHGVLLAHASGAAGTPENHGVPPAHAVDRSIPIGVSARHVHLTERDLFTLFGPHYVLKQAKTLMGGQFAAEEWITVVGTNLRAIEKVRILGPLRDFTQVEISRTDSYALGINPPVRDSGDLHDAAPITLAGPRGVLYLERGCIIAKRHVHMSPADAEAHGVRDKQVIQLRLTGSGDRGGVMDNVLVRVAPSFTLEIHIDTDEANAFGIANGMRAEILEL